MASESRTSPLFIRADASVRIGLGHVMRSLALAQAWQDAGGTATFVMATAGPAVEDRLRFEKMEVIRLVVPSGGLDDAVRVAELARQAKAAWVVIDGYHFGPEYQRVLKGAELRVVCIDDDGRAEPYCADLVLNQNVHAREDSYIRREPSTRLLLGPRFLLLRREFLKWKGWRCEMPRVAQKVLVTLGGGDADNATLKVVRALRCLDLPNLYARIVVGPENPHLEGLRLEADGSPGTLELLTDVWEMPDVMAWADLAVSAGGSTCWELMFLGVPLLGIVMAENQRAILESLAGTGVAVNMGWHECLSVPDLAQILAGLLEDIGARRRMSCRGRTLVDGYGAARTVDLMRPHLLSGRIGP